MMVGASRIEMLRLYAANYSRQACSNLCWRLEEIWRKNEACVSGLYNSSDFR